VFGTLRGGLADLPATLALAARAELRLGRTVTALARTRTGWHAEIADADPVDVDAVVLAVPPPAVRRLLADHAPAAARAAGEIELASSALVLLALPAAAAAPLAGRSGVLVGAGERRPDGLPWTVKAATFSAEKWPHLAPGEDPDDTAVLRLSIGRHGDPASLAALRRDDDDLVSAARDDLAALTGIDAVPAETAVVRWPGGLPQYGVGHVGRVAAIEDGVAGLPGLAVAGAALHGVGVPACLATADAAAHRVAAHLSAAARN
jgi:oxygen-dependent protoporphyrinogen oxidase